MSDQWLDVNGAAEYLMVKPSTIRAWVRDRRIPFHRGVDVRIVRFRRAELDELFERQEPLNSKTLKLEVVNE